MRVRITSADLSSLFSRLSAKGIPLTGVEWISELTAEANISRPNLKKLIYEANKREDKVETIERKGLYWNAIRLTNRPVILVLIVLLSLMAAYLPSRIIFVRVEGNEQLPTKLILERAQECGIGFGASRRRVRSEKMKNALLEALPELKWAGVNTAGCVATISVTERTEAIVPQKQQSGVASIVASRDGVVTELTVTKGNPVCSVGQAVKKGEILVSGYTDCGFKIQASVAEAEVYGLTEHSLEVVMPVNYQEKGTASDTKRKFSLQIGKNKINLYKDSGISPAGCDKMYSQYYLTLPGGFQLPVSLIVEEYRFYDYNEQYTSASAGDVRLRAYAEDYLSQQMLSGTVLSKRVTVDQTQDLYVLNAQYTCRELIGKVQSEEIIGNHGEND